jgi:hypothetical protein
LWFIINPRGRPEAQPGTHDDTVIALALTCIVMARMPLPVKPKPIEPPRVGFAGSKPTDPARGVLYRRPLR